VVTVSPLAPGCLSAKTHHETQNAFPAYQSWQAESKTLPDRPTSAVGVEACINPTNTSCLTRAYIELRIILRISKNSATHLFWVWLVCCLPLQCYVSQRALSHSASEHERDGLGKDAIAVDVHFTPIFQAFCSIPASIAATRQRRRKCSRKDFRYARQLQKIFDIFFSVSNSMIESRRVWQSLRATVLYSEQICIAHDA
jgi:hypothetical protein